MLITTLTSSIMAEKKSKWQIYQDLSHFTSDRCNNGGELLLSSRLFPYDAVGLMCMSLFKFLFQCLLFFHCIFAYDHLLVHVAAVTGTLGWPIVTMWHIRVTGYVLIVRLEFILEIAQIHVGRMNGLDVQWLNAQLIISQQKFRPSYFRLIIVVIVLRLKCSKINLYLKPTTWIGHLTISAIVIFGALKLIWNIKSDFLKEWFTWPRLRMTLYTFPRLTDSERNRLLF